MRGTTVGNLSGASGDVAAEETRLPSDQSLGRSQAAQRALSRPDSRVVPFGRSGGGAPDMSGKNAPQKSADPRRVSRKVQSAAKWLSSTDVWISDPYLSARRARRYWPLRAHREHAIRTVTWGYSDSRMRERIANGPSEGRVTAEGKMSQVSVRQLRLAWLLAASKLRHPGGTCL